MPAPLSPEATALIDRPNFAHLATLMADGSPHSVPVWVGREGDRLLGCTSEGSLQEQLFERRIVVVAGRLDDDAATKAAAALLALDADGDRPIEVHLDSPAGALGAVFVLIDTANTLRSALRILCRGQIGGPAIGVVTAADHCAAVPHARFHLSQPTARFAGTPAEIAAQSRQQPEVLWRPFGRLARRTGRPAEEIAEDTRRGR